MIPHEKPVTTADIVTALEAAGAKITLHVIPGQGIIAALGTGQEMGVRKKATDWSEVNIFLRYYGRRMFPAAVLP